MCTLRGFKIGIVITRKARPFFRAAKKKDEGEVAEEDVEEEVEEGNKSEKMGDLADIRVDSCVWLKVPGTSHPKLRREMRLPEGAQPDHGGDGHRFFGSASRAWQP